MKKFSGLHPDYRCAQIYRIGFGVSFNAGTCSRKKPNLETGIFGDELCQAQFAVLHLGFVKRHLTFKLHLNLSCTSPLRCCLFEEEYGIGEPTEVEA